MALTVSLTPARRVILAVGVPATLALIGLAVAGWTHVAVQRLAYADPVRRPVAFSAPATDGQSRLTVTNADLTLRPGATDRIEVRGNVSGSIAKPVLRRRLGRAGLRLTPLCPVPVAICYLDAGVRVPARLPVTVSDTFGYLDAAGLHGQVTLTSDSGNLTAARLAGTIHLSNQFGDLNASQLSGSVQLTATNGDITATGVTGDTRLRNGFGNITVTGLAGADVVASDNTGDIYLRFSKVPRQVDVTDSFGNVTLVLPRGPATYQVHAAPVPFGSETITVPQSATSTRKITVSDSNGDVSITNG